MRIKNVSEYEIILYALECKNGIYNVVRLRFIDSGTEIFYNNFEIEILRNEI
jgi:hypothetical protein